LVTAGGIQQPRTIKKGKVEEERQNDNYTYGDYNFYGTGENTNPA
jgi:hypothetical protein